MESTNIGNPLPRQPTGRDGKCSAKSYASMKLHIAYILARRQCKLSDKNMKIKKLDAPAKSLHAT
jgi:hypothetical protein